MADGSAGGLLERIDVISRLLDDHAYDKALSVLSGLDVKSVTDVILMLDESRRARLLTIIPADMFIRVANRLPDDILFQFVALRGTGEVARALTSLPYDEATDIIGRLPPRQRAQILSLLPKGVREEIERLLKYDPESVGGVMTTQIPVFNMNMTVGEAIRIYVERDSKRLYDKHFYVYVVDDDGRLYGWIDVRSFLTRPADLRLKDCAKRPPAVVSTTDDREKAARLVVEHDLMEIPVVEGGKLVGAVTIDDVLDIVVSEFSEDLVKYGGTFDVIRSSYIALPSWRLVVRRIPTIIVLYLMDAITGSITAIFTPTIEKIAILAAFLPMLADNSGNIGSQSSTLALRSLVLGEMRPSLRDFIRALAKELLVISLMVLILAPISFIIGMLVSLVGGLNISRALVIASVVSLALVASSYAADITGFFLPVALARAKVDPATASAPVITTIADILTVSVYFMLATSLLHVYAV